LLFWHFLNYNQLAQLKLILKRGIKNMETLKKILAIDDNLMLLELFQKMLSPQYDIQVATSASTALNFLNSHKVDVILLDIEMPNISGFDFLYDIRKIPSYMTVPIIIVSGNSGQDYLVKARSSSAADVLIKPVKKELLIETIEKAISAAK